MSEAQIIVESRAPWCTWMDDAPGKQCGLLKTSELQPARYVGPFGPKART
jgi:hypothetical protein